MSRAGESWQVIASFQEEQSIEAMPTSFLVLVVKIVVGVALSGLSCVRLLAEPALAENRAAAGSRVSEAADRPVSDRAAVPDLLSSELCEWRVGEDDSDK